MRKWILFLLACVLMLCGTAFAEGFDEPLLKNPIERYENPMGETDGSEVTLYMLLDSMNDEAALVEEYGALTVTMTFVDETGAPVQQVDNVFQNSPFGKMQIMRSGKGLFAQEVYMVDGHSFAMFLKQPSYSGQLQTSEEFDAYWESYLFPFGPLDALLGLRQDEAGNAYFLIRSDDVTVFEFATGVNTKIHELRMYSVTEDGETVLSALITNSVGEAEPIPEKVAALIAETLGMPQDAEA